MFTIAIRGLIAPTGTKEYPTMVKTLGEAEIIALDRAERMFGVRNMELVYIEDLDYYVYSSEERIGRLNIKPIYAKVRTRK